MSSWLPPPMIPWGLPPLPPAAPVLYVSLAGNDSNPGTSTQPFLTIQKAVNVALQYAGVGIGVSINIASGSYVGAVLSSNGLAFNGAGANQAPASITLVGGWGGGTTTITKSPLGPGCIIVNGWGAAITIGNNITIQSTAIGLFAYAGGAIYVSGVGITFGTCTQAHMHADSHGQINIGTDYTITGGSTAHIECSLRAFIGYYEVNHTVTLSGAPVFSVAFIHAQDTSVVYVPSGNVTFAGAAGATTVRFLITTGAILETNNGGGSYIPGTSPGQMNSQGRYSPLPLPTLTALTGFGAGAAAIMVAGSTDQEGYIQITTGAAPGNSGSVTLNTSTTGPTSVGALGLVLAPGTAGWSTTAVASSGGSTATSVVIQMDNNGVAFGAGTLFVGYILRPF